MYSASEGWLVHLKKQWLDSFLYIVKLWGLGSKLTSECILGVWQLRNLKLKPCPLPWHLLAWVRRFVHATQWLGCGYSSMHLTYVSQTVPLQLGTHKTLISLLQPQSPPVLEPGAINTGLVMHAYIWYIIMLLLNLKRAHQNNSWYICMQSAVWPGEGSHFWPTMSYAYNDVPPPSPVGMMASSFTPAFSSSGPVPSLSLASVPDPSVAVSFIFALLPLATGTAPAALPMGTATPGLPQLPPKLMQRIL